MRRRLALIVTSIAALSSAAPAHAGFFAGEQIDGPSPDIRSVGGLDVARDGSGAVVYVRRDAGVDHVFVSRLVNGGFNAPERVDTGLEAAGSQPVVAVSDGGRIVVAFISGGQSFVAVRPDGATAWSPPQVLGSGASGTSIDMSINGAAYVTWTSSGDVLGARLDRGGTTFAPLDAPLDINPAADAGSGNNRSRVAIAADGTAVAVWGEAGHVYARRLYGTKISAAPMDLTSGDLDGHAAGPADLPEVDIEDDSSFAWVSFRQSFADGGAQKARAIGRRLRGSRMEDPVPYDGLGWGGEGVVSTHVDLNGKGEGVMTAGTTGGSAVAAILKDDKLNVATPVGGSGVPSFPMGAIAETTDRVVGWIGAGDGTVHGVHYDDDPAVRTVPLPGPDTALTNPEFGSVDAQAGFDVAGDRLGDVALVFIQGAADGRRLVAASYDRPPGAFQISTSSSRWRNIVKAPVTWGSSQDLWGPLTFNVLVDGKVVSTTQDTKSQVPPGAVSEGVHSWRVVAVDRHGQSVTTPVRPLKVDTVAPAVSFSVKRKQRVATVTVKASDVLPPSGQASGIDFVRIEFGDRKGFVQARKAAHVYGHTGAFTVRVSATDRAGNVTVAERRIHIGGK
jgi:hypothetical protein